MIVRHSRELRQPPTPLDPPVAELDGASPAMLQLKRDIVHVARDPFVGVLVVGESGTGKERVARAIHRVSARAARPFVVVDCAGLAPTLAEDALFGHVRGAFTGAVAHVAGPFERADGGTVFLDEIGELTRELQVKLLRALQQRAVARLGAASETSFDVRIVAATNVDLRRAVDDGRFREDLFYRLRVFDLRVPALRERGFGDVQRLAVRLLDQLAARRGRPAPSLAPAVWEQFARHSWPGNVRELENTLERMMVAAAEDPQLTPAHLPCGFGSMEARHGPVLASQVAAPTAVTASDAYAALTRNHFRHGRAASELGISRHQLYRLLKRRADGDAAAGGAGA
jgi:transcriptional regulator with PAS, ATPase and Fis domain